MNHHPSSPFYSFLLALCPSFADNRVRSVSLPRRILPFFLSFLSSTVFRFKQYIRDRGVPLLDFCPRRTFHPWFPILQDSPLWRRCSNSAVTNARIRLFPRIFRVRNSSSSLSWNPSFRKTPSSIVIEIVRDQNPFARELSFFSHP